MEKEGAGDGRKRKEQVDGCKGKEQADEWKRKEQRDGCKGKKQDR